MLAFRQNSHDFLHSSQICEQYHLIIYKQLCTCIYSAFLGESLRKKYFTDAVSSLILSLKKQPPDTFLIPDGCFALLYFIPQLFCCHVALCQNFTLFAALPLLVCSFDSAKVKLICNICACQIYYFAVVVDGVDTVKACLIKWEWI